MFGRASKLPFSCFRCQKRLTDQGRPWQSPSVLFSTANGPRFHNTAAIETNDEEPTQENPSSNVRDGSDISRHVAARNSQNATRYRRWRPHNAEDLGVSVLGKPAEVLILPTRDRRLQHEDAEEEKNDTKVKIHESLSSELKPISAAEVLNNIDSMKTELEKDASDLTVDKWNDIRHRLAGGFTKSQLQEYLRVATGKAQWDTKEAYTPTNSQKRKLAGWIMMKAWGWKCIDAEKRDADLTVKKSVDMTMPKLEFLMLDQRQPLKQISERFDVQVDVFKKTRKIEFSGSAEAVSSAAAHLRSISKEIQTASLQILHSTTGIWSNNTNEELLLEELMQKHNMLIRRDKQLLRTVGYASSDTDAVLRDLSVMSDRSSTATGSTFWRGQLQEETSRVSIYPREIPKWLNENYMWYRHICTSTADVAEGSSLDEDGREVSKWLRDVSKSAEIDQKRLSPFRVESGALTHQYMADLGQVLFTDGGADHETEMKKSSRETSKPSLLSPYRALLPQMMSGKNFCMAETGKSRNNNATRPFLLLLRLRPATPNFAHPDLEIILRGDDLSLGIRQQLEIKKVIAVLDQWQHHLLLPHQPVDIRITRRSELDLLCGASSTLTKGYLHMLKQLGTYLERAHTSHNGSFAAIWSLDVTSLLKDHVIASEKNGETSLSVFESKDNANEPHKPGSTLSSGLKYVLDPPEYLDVTTYTSSLLGNRYLEDISCDAGQVEKPAQRQILRVVQSPLFDLLHSKENSQDKSTVAASRIKVQTQQSFQETAGVAYNIAKLFADFDRRGS